ncbi:MAG: SUMF1/EgtB/PvdO family nonheme iron enzyme [Paludibacter sp.]|nr:SUMF1/EgtB/PvdO family nonheme iron enzyme [Paludibacter sp.]MDD4199018.1 SUMF1/EgtB/PvdO family nonheme iron enzyme [Paludibacter sp.]MDD4427131.1 SUMF1/EgtB/PvdO family nonheme iron enzyme [Paludibacter sp.]
MNLKALIQLLILVIIMTMASCNPDIEEPVVEPPDTEKPGDEDPDEESGELAAVSTIRFTSTKDAQLLIINTKGNWSITTDVDWIQCTQTSGKGKIGILVGVPSNPDFQRKGNLRITTSSKQHDITISQAGASQITITVGEVTFKMVLVEAGSFIQSAYGSSYYTHTVQLDSFYIADVEVSNALCKAVTGVLPYDTMTTSAKDNPIYIASSLPVSHISYHDIVTNFLPALKEKTQFDFRLPTEAEWEMAARGGNYSKQYIYAGSNQIDEVAWTDSNSGSKKHAVGTLKPNELGLYDMSGNLSEWCSDWYGDYPNEAVKNPQGPATGELRMIRGGNYYSSALFSDNVECRTDYRGYLIPSCYEVAWPGTEYERVNYRCETVGFRLALSVPKN